MRDIQTLLQYSVISRQQHKKYTYAMIFLESCKTVADVVTNERNAFFLLVDPGLLYLRLEIKKQQRRHLFKAFIFSIIRNWHPVKSNYINNDDKKRKCRLSSLSCPPSAA